MKISNNARIKYAIVAVSMAHILLLIIYLRTLTEGGVSVYFRNVFRSSCGCVHYFINRNISHSKEIYVYIY